MSFRHLLAATAAISGAFALSSCDDAPGRPKPENRWTPPSSVTDFATLYRENCLACHSDGTTTSASIPMSNPFLLAMLPEERLRDVIANGIPGTAMPSLSIAKSGVLTEEQIDSLVKGILAWKEAHPVEGPVPAYSAPLGDVVAGGQAFGMYCASCHGADGTGATAGSVVAPAYLALVSDQYLRTVTIAGRPDLGCPDYRSRVPNQPMSDDDIANVVAWLASQRKPGPAEPPEPGESN